MSWEERWNAFLAEAEKNSEDEQDSVDYRRDDDGNSIYSSEEDEQDDPNGDDGNSNEKEDDIFPVPARVCFLSKEMEKPEKEMEKRDSEIGAESKERRGESSPGPCKRRAEMSWQENWNAFLAEAEKNSTNFSEDEQDSVDYSNGNSIYSSEENDQDSVDHLNGDDGNSDEEEDIFPVPARVCFLSKEMENPVCFLSKEMEKPEKEMEKPDSKRGAESEERRGESKRRALAEAFSAL